MSNSNSSRKRLFIVALCLALLVMALGVMTASADTSYPVPGNTQGWAVNSNQDGGSSTITANAPRSGNGSVELRGNRTRWQKGASYLSSNLGLLSEVTDFSFDWMVATDSTSNLGANYTPTFRLLIRDANKNWELAWEGANQGTVVTKGAWVSTDATASNQKFWKYTSGGTAGSPPYKSLSEWQNDTAAFTSSAYVYGISVGIGSGPGSGYHAFADNITIGFNNAPITYNFETTPPVKLTLNAADDMICNAPMEMTIDLSNVANLYGYELKVNYDEDLVSAGGAFVTTWFDGYGAGAPWNGSCSGGVCSFASTLLNPQEALSGAGTVAKITFTPLSAGSFTAAVDHVLLSNRDGELMNVDVNDADFDFDVCGQASISGQISLQGRMTPMDSGFIKLVDTSNQFPAINATFDANGNYSVTGIPVVAGGSNYVIQATHYLYLGNEKALTLNPGDALTGQNTRLLGGDADNSGLTSLLGIDITDIGCIGNAFGGAGAACGAHANSGTDINKDNITNIQDLSIAGGNFNKNPFQNW